MEALLLKNDILDTYICGLATDICVGKIYSMSLVLQLHFLSIIIEIYVAFSPPFLFSFLHIEYIDNHSDHVLCSPLTPMEIKIILRNLHSASSSIII